MCVRRHKADEGGDKRERKKRSKEYFSMSFGSFVSFYVAVVLRPAAIDEIQFLRLMVEISKNERDEMKANVFVFDFPVQAIKCAKRIVHCSTTSIEILQRTKEQKSTNSSSGSSSSCSSGSTFEEGNGVALLILDKMQKSISVDKSQCLDFN